MIIYVHVHDRPSDKNSSNLKFSAYEYGQWRTEIEILEAGIPGFVKLQEYE